ncbi:MAG: META domain-containing protein [Burkholderiales bacterium]|jgi:heat shock protein HslJ|nr:META domain-containing protein [Burkholderiales bacterium]
MNRLANRAAAILAAGLLLNACTAMTPAATTPDLDKTAWVLSSLPGHALKSDALPTARFEGGRIVGTDGCNRYTAPYTVTGSTLQVGAGGAATMMACPPEIMKQADAFMGALRKANTFRTVDGQLQLLAADGAVVATFAAQRQALAGTSWQVTGYNNGRQAVVSVLSGTNLTLAFSDDGRATGLAGCNNFNAAYKQDGEKLTIGPAAATRKMCASPAGVMEQEQQFLKALETVTTARMEGDRLELRTAAGALAATLAKK